MPITSPKMKFVLTVVLLHYLKMEQLLKPLNIVLTILYCSLLHVIYKDISARSVIMFFMKKILFLILKKLYQKKLFLLSWRNLSQPTLLLKVSPAIFIYLDKTSLMFLTDI